MIFIIHIHSTSTAQPHHKPNGRFCDECSVFVYFLHGTHHIVSCDNAHQMILNMTCVSCCTISAMSC